MEMRKKVTIIALRVSGIKSKKKTRLLHTRWCKRQGKQAFHPQSIQNSKARPKMIGIEEAVKGRVNSNNADMAPRRIPHHGPRDGARVGIPVGLDAQGPINPQFQDGLVLGRLFGGVVVTLIALVLEAAQSGAQGAQFAFQTLALNLEVRGGFGEAELLRVEGQDALGVGGWVVAGLVGVVFVLLVVGGAGQVG